MILATIVQPEVEDYNDIKQGCHHLQATSTNREMLQQPYSSLGTTPTLLFTSSSSNQEHSHLSGVLDYSYPLLLVNTKSNKQLETTTELELKLLNIEEVTNTYNDQ